MTGRCLFFTVLTVVGAAAVPAAHGFFGGGCASHHAWLHCGASLHGAPGEGMPSPDEMRARVDTALDTLGLDPETRAKAKSILEPHVEKAIALHEKVASGELPFEAAMTEHEQIVAAAKSDLASVLTAKQIEQFVDQLHPQHECARGE